MFVSLWILVPLVILAIAGVFGIGFILSPPPSTLFGG
jgi:hypothetical protein